MTAAAAKKTAQQTPAAPSAPAETAQAAPPAPAAPMAVEPVQQLTPTVQRVQARTDAIRLAEHTYNRWSIIAPADHSLEQVCDLRYAWHAHDRIKPGDIIEIRSANFQFTVEILVREIDTEAQAILGFYTIRDLAREELRVPDLSAASVKEMGGPHGWAVMLGSQHLKSGFETQGEAVAWLRKKQARGN
jgi:hypothetical protein